MSNNREYIFGIGRSWTRDYSTTRFFTEKQGLVPLLMRSGRQDCMFLSSTGFNTTYPENCRIAPFETTSKLNYISNRAHYNRTRGAHTNKTFHIYSGFMSVIGHGTVTAQNSNFPVNSRPDYTLHTDKYDILVLAVTRKRAKLEISDTYLSVKSQKITLLVNKNKMTDSFMRKHYNLVVKERIEEFLNQAKSAKVEIEYVPDKYLQGFMSTDSIELATRSLTEMSKIEREVKDKVLDTLTIKEF